MNATRKRTLAGAVLAIWSGAGFLGLAVIAEADDAPVSPGRVVGEAAARAVSIGIPTRPGTRPTTHAPKPVPRPTRSAAAAYANCAAVRKAGAAPIHRGEPGYSRKLDRNNDGVGCE